MISPGKTVTGRRFYHYFADDCHLMGDNAQMIHHIWRLSEPGEENLGLAITDDGLVLGHTLLSRRHRTA
jgi:hypothetical protein